MLVIKNGRVLDPASKTDAMLDVLLDGGQITQAGANLSVPGAETLDATGLIVAPAAFIAEISASASPLLPIEAAPIGQTRTLATAAARSTMLRVTDALSFTG